jgi:hypothetical protein
MAGRTFARRRVASRIAVIARTDPDDPRLPSLRERADALHVAEIAEWARLAAAALPPLTHAEIIAVRREVAAIDKRLTRRAAS